MTGLRLAVGGVVAGAGISLVTIDNDIDLLEQPPKAAKRVPSRTATTVTELGRLLTGNREVPCS